MRDYPWTGGLPHLSGLFHLPGIPHLHVNRPLVCVAGGIIHATCGECEGDTFFCGYAARMAASRRQNLHAGKNNRLFSLFVLFSYFRQHNGAPENVFFKCCLMHVNPLAYVCIITEFLWRTSRGLN